ncbi:MAG: RnfABCDGE type electron transport complex subunit G [Acutalibacteraceae bacterium]|nr:RnfABCDGE type electron transport complex subunit G [Acutalibacteraceae bacterium]
MAKLIEIIKSNKNDIIKPVAVLLAICIIIPLALSLTNKITKDKIAELDAKNSSETMASLIEADKFTEETFEDGENKFAYNLALKDGEIIGYIFKTAEKGYGGDVSVMTAVNPDGTVKSVAILDVSNETPGLGQNAAKESFYTQYAGKESGISLLKNGADSAKNEVNAVTGATITSTAVNKAVNEALKQFENVKSTEEVTEGEK